MLSGGFNLHDLKHHTEYSGITNPNIPSTHFSLAVLSSGSVNVTFNLSLRQTSEHKMKGEPGWRWLLEG